MLAAQKSRLKAGFHMMAAITEKKFSDHSDHMDNDRSDHSNKDRWDSDCSNSNLTILGCTAFPTVKHFWKISGTQSLWVIVFHVIFKPESMIHSCHIEFDKWHEQCSLFTFSVTAAINWKSSIATIAQPSKLLQQS